jgi:KDO2-lipid IV(A) lauroyltransferase
MYYLLYSIFFLLSILPLRVLYLFSDLAWFLIYHVIGYRRKIVLQNLAIAFPEKSEQERIIIAGKFYRNLTDTFVETIKLLTASDKFLENHFRCDNSLFEQLHREGKKLQVHLGHNFNWELANVAMAHVVPYPMLVVYMPINNNSVDRLFKKIRTRTGAILLPATKINSALLPYVKQQYLLVLVADQNPGIPSKAYWLNFFGRPTPFVKGPEKGARLNNTAVVFTHFTKTKRGIYDVHLSLAAENPKSMKEGDLTAIYIKYLEKVIREQPEMWLWSHRRWKHEWKPEYGPVMEQ